MTVAAIPRRDRVVGIADLGVSTDRAERLVTYALGSCLGITAWDPVAGVGGMLHVMLPLSELDRSKAERNPAMFVDTGVPELLRICLAAGAVKERLVIRVAGGSQGGDGRSPDRFQVGRRNMIELRKQLWLAGLFLRAEDIGGLRVSRTMALEMQAGVVSVKSGNREITL